MNPRRIAASCLAVVLAAILIALVVFSSIADEAGSMFHEDAGGSSAFLAEAEAQGLDTQRLLSGPHALRAETAETENAPPRTLYVVVAPDRAYVQDEVDALTDFLLEGGRVLVADNFGQANTLTTPFGITFERVRLVNGPGAETFQVTLGGKEYSVHPGQPTAIHLHPEATSTVLAWSSVKSYLDRDGDGLVNAWEPTGPFPVMVEAEVGTSGGRIFAISDPSLLDIDADESLQDEAFLRAVIEYALPDGGRIIVDESRMVSDDPFLGATAMIVGAATEDPWRAIFIAFASALFVAGALVVVHGMWGPHRFTLDRFIRRKDLQSTDGESDVTRDENRATTQATTHWTRRGKVAAFGGLLLAVTGTALGNLQSTYAGAFLLAAATLSMWTKAPRVGAHRLTTVHRVHEESRTPMDFTLAARGPGYTNVEVRDHIPQEFQLASGHNWFRTTLRPKKETRFRYEFRAGLRGPYRVGPLRIRTTDPFGLRTVETEASIAHKMLVLPRDDPLNRIPFKSRIPDLTIGPHLVNRAGDGTEFHSLRDYQTGDSIRIVNWKASARSKDLVVNQRVHESRSTLHIFLDARLISQAGHLRFNPINQGCRAAQSIVSGGLQARDDVRVFVYGDGVKELCKGIRRGKGYELSEALASVKAAGQMTFLEAADEVVPTLRSGPAILISGMEGDPSILDGLKMLAQRSIPSTVIALEIGTAPENDEQEAEPGGVRLQTERDEMIAHIRGAEIPVVPMVPGLPLGTLFQVALQ